MQLHPLNKKKLTTIVLAIVIMLLISLGASLLSLAAAVTIIPSTATTTTTPIKHLIVIFQENISFDHYFATYPNSKNLLDEPPFHAAV